MPNYRRIHAPGGTYFFTLALADRTSDLLTREVTALRAAVARTRSVHPFHIDAWVILPDHMHAVWTLPKGDAAYSARWSLIKRWFSAAIPRGETRSNSRTSKGERGIWQRRFWEHTIRNADDYARHVDYIHFNPVKHRLAQTPAEWPFSSFHRAVQQGLYPADWAAQDDATQEYGERPPPP